MDQGRVSGDGAHPLPAQHCQVQALPQTWKTDTQRRLGTPKPTTYRVHKRDGDHTGIDQCALSGPLQS
jgi:hypothetical protein